MSTNLHLYFMEWESHFSEIPTMVDFAREMNVQCNFQAIQFGLNI